MIRLALGLAAALWALVIAFLGSAEGWGVMPWGWVAMALIVIAGYCVLTWAMLTGRAR